MTARRLFYRYRTGLRPAGLRIARTLAALLLAVGLVAPAAAQDASDFFLRLNALENQVREQAGTIERLEFENRRLQDQMKRFQEDVEFRFQDLEGGKKRSDLSPAAPRTDDPGAGQALSPAGTTRTGMTQTTTPAVPASSISAGAGAAGGAPETVDAAAADELAVGTTDFRNREFAMQDASAPVLAMPRIDTPAVTTVDEGPGAGRPLDLGAVAGAGRADPFQQPGTQPLVTPVGDTAAAGIPSVAATAPGNPQVGYRNAEALLRRQDFAGAEMGFREFLQSHPRDGLAPDATFNLGESYFFRGRYREAAEQYLRLTTAYSASPRAPEGMLKLGMSLEALGARDQACATFTETLRKYSAAGPDVQDGVARARARAECS